MTDHNSGLMFHIDEMPVHLMIDLLCCIEQYRPGSRVCNDNDGLLFIILAPELDPASIVLPLSPQANGIPTRMDRLRCLGNAVVPQVAEWVGKRILEAA